MNLMKQYFGSKILKKNHDKGKGGMISQRMQPDDFGEQAGRTINAANCLLKLSSAAKGPVTWKPQSYDR
jgi:hypothetical protein